MHPNPPDLCRYPRKTRIGQRAYRHHSRGKAALGGSREGYLQSEDRSSCLFESLAPNGRMRGAQFCNRSIAPRREGLRVKGVGAIDSSRETGGTVALWCTRSVPSGFASVTCHSHPKCFHTRSKGRFRDITGLLHHACVAPSGTPREGFTHSRQTDRQTDRI